MLIEVNRVILAVLLIHAPFYFSALSQIHTFIFAIARKITVKRHIAKIFRVIDFFLLFLFCVVIP